MTMPDQVCGIAAMLSCDIAVICRGEVAANSCDSVYGTHLRLNKLIVFHVTFKLVVFLFLLNFVYFLAFCVI